MIEREKYINTLVCGARAYGIMLDDNKISMFETYTELLMSWNKKMNLISKRDTERFVEYHLLDSLKVSSCCDISVVRSLLDFGSGAGFPGIPLAIAFPEIRLSLVDSRLKQCTFLKEVLKNIPYLKATVIHSRVENLPETLNGAFDMVITRATSNLSTFFSLTARFIYRHGSLVAIKGDTIDDELHDLKNTIDSKLFNIYSTVPKAVKNVRQGNIVIIYCA
ncbi:MAG: 16S rRNA (guanine(527)-N(7))-methyltransferase RsmG [Candidatus Latescibacteria bacterium]|jgi:16S rRNA (guanine527-N7)-methyltransferase|nr:16S rRNA (guanine(527)-N(7))-methyltransferase RsmG [Candidatus Latescibacterota bacterium]